MPQGASVCTTADRTLLGRRARGCNGIVVTGRAAFLQAAALAFLGLFTCGSRIIVTQRLTGGIITAGACFRSSTGGRFKVVAKRIPCGRRATGTFLRGIARGSNGIVMPQGASGCTTTAGALLGYGTGGSCITVTERAAFLQAAALAFLGLFTGGCRIIMPQRLTGGIIAAGACFRSSTGSRFKVVAKRIPCSRRATGTFLRGIARGSNGVVVPESASGG